MEYEAFVIKYYMVEVEFYFCVNDSINIQNKRVQDDDI